MNSFELTLTREQYGAALLKAKQAGVVLTEGCGSLPETSGVQMNYTITGTCLEGPVTVTITVIKKPFVVSVGMIESRVKALLGLA